MTDPTLPALEGLLEGLIAEHERLLEVTRRHRKAISAADSVGIGACIQEQNETVQRIAELETRRAATVAKVAGSNGVKLSTIAERLPASPARDRVMTLGERLKGLLGTLHKEHEVLRSAATALAAHMDGLMRQIGRSLSHAGTYDRPGRLGAMQVMTALDMTS